MSEDGSDQIALALRRARPFAISRTFLASTWPAPFHQPEPRPKSWRHLAESFLAKPDAATAFNGSEFVRLHMNTMQIEQAIQAKGLTAPRVTHDELMDNIAHVEYVKHTSHSGQVLRWAVITTRNGFAVTGRPSCSVSAANDDEEIGKDRAFANAKDELWPLMGYALRSTLAQAA